MMRDVLSTARPCIAALAALVLALFVGIWPVHADTELLKYHYDTDNYCIRLSDAVLDVSEYNGNLTTENKRDIVSRAGIQILEWPDADMAGEPVNLGDLSFDFSEIGNTAGKGYPVTMTLPDGDAVTFKVYISGERTHYGGLPYSGESGTVLSEGEAEVKAEETTLTEAETEARTEPAPVVPMEPETERRDWSIVPKVGIPVSLLALIAVAAMVASDLRVLIWYGRRKRERDAECA